jgi:hypothetical protein
MPPVGLGGEIAAEKLLDIVPKSAQEIGPRIPLRYFYYYATVSLLLPFILVACLVHRLAWPKE